MVVTSHTFGAANARFAKHAVVGQLMKFDAASKTAVVKLAAGTVEVFKVTENTLVQGVKDGVNLAALAGNEGGYFVVRYTEEGANKTAESFRYIGAEFPKVTDGTITGIDKAGHAITIKTADGAEETYHLSDKCVIDTGMDIAEGAEAVSQALRNGEIITIHYTTEGGKKIAHLVKEVF
jgi:Cu/Ag efflux protein CusF